VHSFCLTLEPSLIISRGFGAKGLGPILANEKRLLAVYSILYYHLRSVIIYETLKIVKWHKR